MTSVESHAMALSQAVAAGRKGWLRVDATGSDREREAPLLDTGWKEWRAAVISCVKRRAVASSHLPVACPSHLALRVACLASCAWSRR